MKYTKTQLPAHLVEFKQKIATEIVRLKAEKGLKDKYFELNRVAKPQLSGIINNNKNYTLESLLLTIELLGESPSEFFGRLK